MTTTDQGPRTAMPGGWILETAGGWHSARGHAAGFPGAAAP